MFVYCELVRSTSRTDQPDTFTLPVIGRNEVHPSLGQCLLHRRTRAESRVLFAPRQPGDGVERDNGLVGQILLRPAKQGAGGPDLSRGDHG